MLYFMLLSKGALPLKFMLRSQTFLLSMNNVIMKMATKGPPIRPSKVDPFIPVFVRMPRDPAQIFINAKNCIIYACDTVYSYLVLQLCSSHCYPGQCFRLIQWYLSIYLQIVLVVYTCIVYGIIFV